MQTKKGFCVSLCLFVHPFVRAATRIYVSRETFQKLLFARVLEKWQWLKLLVLDLRNRWKKNEGITRRGGWWYGKRLLPLIKHRRCVRVLASSAGTLSTFHTYLHNFHLIFRGLTHTYHKQCASTAPSQMLFSVSYFRPLNQKKKKP